MSRYKKRYRIRFTDLCDHVGEEVPYYIIEYKVHWFSWETHWYCKYGDRFTIEEARRKVQILVSEDEREYRRSLREEEFRKTSVPEYYP